MFVIQDGPRHCDVVVGRLQKSINLCISGNNMNCFPWIRQKIYKQFVLIRLDKFIIKKTPLLWRSIIYWASNRDFTVLRIWRNEFSQVSKTFICMLSQQYIEPMNYLILNFKPSRTFMYIYSNTILFVIILVQSGLYIIVFLNKC